MPLSIRNPRAEELARAVAAETGENMTQAIIAALSERLERLKGSRIAGDLLGEILAIGQRCSELPLVDDRPMDEILGYGPYGVPQ